MREAEHIRHRADGSCVIRTGVPFGKFYEGSWSVGERWLQFRRRLPCLCAGTYIVFHIFLRSHFGLWDGFAVLLIVMVGAGYVVEQFSLRGSRRTSEGAWRAAGDYLAQQRR